MAKKKELIIEEPQFEENIQNEPLEEVMGDRYATYAKYVIQDRAIPDARDGMKPVQRRIIFSMYKSNNTINHPTKKCAHTVGAVMGTYHPHGDTSIYEALARMSQDWKLRYPLIDFQGNNGSIDGDNPAAYRYTESRLAMISNELVRGIDKETVDMQLNFDDTEFEPVVLPARFPNLLVNGSEGIAVAIATEIPPHNLREVIDAVIYYINHKNVTIEDLRQFVKGPDFPTGGVIYNSNGLDDIYNTGRGRIEVAAKAEIVETKTNQQIIITEIPYKLVKIDVVYEIDKIRHSKAIDGILEVRDESDWKGIRIVVDLKKESKADLILAYLMKHTSLRGSYSANMVAIVDGRPKTLTLYDFIECYVNHQVDVITRQSKFDLNKASSRLSIVNGLIIATLNINDVIALIQHSKDKADAKNNLIKKYSLTEDQAEAIVMMPLYKLSHADEVVLETEKKQLEKQIETLNGILSDENKLHRVLIKDLKEIAEKYGDDRRTQIIDKTENVVINKRDLIAKEEVMVAVTRDGYLKRSSIKSYKGSGDDVLPGLKDGDVLVGRGSAMTTDYLVCFTNKGNYVCLPVYVLTENRWKDEGIHINNLVNLMGGEKFIKCLFINKFRDDIFLGFVSKFGQIKRMQVSQLDNSKHARPVKCMKLLNTDEIADICVLNGDTDLLILTSDGNCSLYNENDVNLTGAKAGGVKSINNLKNQNVVSMLSFDENDRNRLVLFTDKGCQRILSLDKINKTSRLGKVQVAFSSFKSDVHHLVGSAKIPYKTTSLDLRLLLSNNELLPISITDFSATDTINAKKNIKDIPAGVKVASLFDVDIELINDKTISRAKINNDINIEESGEVEEEISEEKAALDAKAIADEIQEEDEKVEQISLFEGLDEDL